MRSCYFETKKYLIENVTLFLFRNHNCNKLNLQSLFTKRKLQGVCFLCLQCDWFSFQVHICTQSQKVVLFGARRLLPCLEFLALVRALSPQCTAQRREEQGNEYNSGKRQINGREKEWRLSTMHSKDFEKGYLWMMEPETGNYRR